MRDPHSKERLLKTFACRLFFGQGFAAVLVPTMGIVLGQTFALVHLATRAECVRQVKYSSSNWKESLRCMSFLHGGLWEGVRTRSSRWDCQNLHEHCSLYYSFSLLWANGSKNIQCYCNTVFSLFCLTSAVCFPRCSQGQRCVRPGVCSVCAEGYTGNNCQTRKYSFMEEQLLDVLEFMFVLVLCRFTSNWGGNPWDIWEC